MARPPKDPELLMDVFALNALIEKHYTKLGVAILTSWQFPREIAVVPQNLTEHFRNIEKPDLADVILVAKLEILKGTLHPLAFIDKTELPAYERLKLDPRITLRENEQFKQPLALAEKLFE